MITPLAVFLLTASPIGLWITGSGASQGKVEIARCGGGLCGRLVDAARFRVEPDQRDVHNPDPALRSRPVRGLMVLKNFTGGPPVWRGEAYDPKSGLGAHGVTLRFTGADRLQVKGCVALICRSQTFRRAP